MISPLHYVINHCCHRAQICPCGSQIDCCSFTKWIFLGLFCVVYANTSVQLNPLTTYDECTHHATLAACYVYQLAQSILKIGFALAKKVGQGEVGWFQHGVPCTYVAASLAGCRKALVGTDLAISLAWLAVEKPWLALAGPFLSFLTQTGVDKACKSCN